MPTSAQTGQSLFIEKASEPFRKLDGRTFTVNFAVTCHGVSLFIFVPQDLIGRREEAPDPIDGGRYQLFISDWENCLRPGDSGTGHDWIYNDPPIVTTR